MGLVNSAQDPLMCTREKLTTATKKKKGKHANVNAQRAIQTVTITRENPSKI